MHVHWLVALVLIAGGCSTVPGRPHGQALQPRVPHLVVTLDSRTATATLSWQAATAGQFRRYEVYRDGGDGFALLDTLVGRQDTVYVDGGLAANRRYEYQVAVVTGDERSSTAQRSAASGGAVHGYAGGWATGDAARPFLPTRLVVDRTGVVAAVGIGSGQVRRYRDDGTPLDTLIYAQESLACLAAGAVDGPGLALDAAGNLYVLYNVLRPGQRPEPWWSKFAPDGQLLWNRALEGLFARHITVDAQDRIFVETISQLQQFDTAGVRLETQQVPAVLVASLRLWGGRFAALVEPLSLLAEGWQAPRLVVYGDPARESSTAVLGRDPLSARDRGSGLLQRPTDFAVTAAADRAFVVNAGLDRVEAFTLNGYVTHWGTAGAGVGQFAFAGQAAVLDDLMTGRVAVRAVHAGGIACGIDDCILVADTFNERIQKFQP